MNKFFLVASMLLVSIFMYAQNDADGYNFTVVKENPITSIKNQANSGTCWSFAGVSMLESELLRMGKGTHDLSEMYIVRRNYEDQAKKYARMHGSLNFSAGGSFADVIETLDEYGVVPGSEYVGLEYGEDNHKHGEVDHLLKGYMDAVIANKNRSLSPVWFKGYMGILDAYFGEKPDSLTSGNNSTDPQRPIDLVEQESLTRFDKRKTNNNRKKKKKLCTSHQITVEAIEYIVLNDLKRVFETI